MTMITPSYLGETIEYSSLHACRSTLEDPSERRVELQAEALDRIARSAQNDWRRFLLAETLQAYSDLDPADWERLQQLFLTEKYREARPMTLTYYERGKIEGQNKERLETVLLQLEAKFGLLSPAVKSRVEAMSPEQLRQLTVAFARYQTLKELGLED